jgi:uncharacterized protein with PIN domain
MEQNKCVCNQCGNEIMIHLNEETIDQDNNGKDVVEQFFVCPNCGQRYTVMILDEYMRTLIRMRKRPPFNRKNNEKIKKDMMQHFKRLKEKYNRE